MHDYKVPRSHKLTASSPVDRQVDADSMNPHRWTRDLLSTALRANQLGNARIKAYEVSHS